MAREIDATYLIQGSVRRAGTKIRVTAELIAPENGEQLWTGRYDRDIGDLFAMQDEIVTSLSAALAPEIFRAEASAPDPVVGHRTNRLGSVPKGAFPLLSADKGRFRSLDCPVQGGHRARSGAGDRARLSRHRPGAGRAIRMAPEHQPVVGRGDVPRREQRAARSPFIVRVFDTWPICTPWMGITTPRWMPGNGRSN